MTRKQLTDRTVAALKPRPGERLTLADGVVPGLAIRVNATSKTWTLTYRVGRRQRRWTIGAYQSIGVADARKRARRALNGLADGVDPAAAKMDAREGRTFAELADAYVKHAQKKKRSWMQDEGALRRVLRPAWKHRLVKEITRRDVRDLIDPIVERGALVQANRTQALISTIFNYALEADWLETGNPAARIKKQPEKSRTRVLNDDEVRALWAALEAAKPPLRRVTDPAPAPAIAPMIAIGLQVVLLTAQRNGEVFTMQTSDVDLDEGWWTIPETISKNHQAHRVPLVPRVVELLRAAQELAPDHNRYVFAGDKGASVAARANKAIRALRLAQAITFECRRHDLRRTAATNMAKAGIPRETIAKVLNHVDRGSRATTVYDRHTYDAEKRVALETWARRLESILAPKADAAHVVPFTREKGAAISTIA